MRLIALALVLIMSSAVPSVTIFPNGLNPAQQQSLDYLDARYADGSNVIDILVQIGSLACGKTVFDCGWILKQAIAVPGSRQLIARSQWSDFEQTTLKTMERDYPPELLLSGFTHSNTTNTVLIRTAGQPSEIVYGGLYSGGSDNRGKLLGSEYNNAFIDQGESVSMEAIDHLTGRVGRWTCADGTKHGGQIVISANPPCPLLVRRFVREKPAKTVVLQFTMYDNAMFLGNGKLGEENDYIARVKRGKSSAWIAKYVMGELAVEEGLVYWMLDESKTFVDVLPQWTGIETDLIGLDWGFNKSEVSCHHYRTDVDGTRWILDEVYALNLTVDEFDSRVRAKGWHPEKWLCVPDQAMYAPESDGQSIITKLRNRGWQFVDGGVSKRFEHGIPICQGRLGMNPRTGRSWTQIYTPNCPNAVRELQDYIWDTDGKERPKPGQKDHFCDEWRYVESWFGSNNVPTTPETPLSAEQREAQLIAKSNERALGLSRSGIYQTSKSQIDRGGRAPFVNHAGLSKISEYK